MGAKVQEVGPAVPNQGAFVQPTILTALGEDNPARYCEFFGPASMLFRAKNEDDAVRIANDSPVRPRRFGLHLRSAAWRRGGEEDLHRREGVSRLRTAPIRQSNAKRPRRTTALMLSRSSLAAVRRPSARLVRYGPPTLDFPHS